LIDTYKADFIQKSIGNDQSLDEIVKGTFYFKRPGMFLWFSSPPNNQKIIVNKDLVWIHDIDFNQVIVRSLDKEITKTPLYLLINGPELLSEKYLIEKTVVELTEQSGEYIFKSKMDVDNIQVFSAKIKSGLIHSLKIEDRIMGSMEINFKNIEKNIDIKESMFTYVPDKDTDIID
tara:strand:+ start:2359 stop:2886 length:528 start_codon:yes stop_codon:yes gene_type:complete